MVKGRKIQPMSLKRRIHRDLARALGVLGMGFVFMSVSWFNPGTVQVLILTLGLSLLLAGIWYSGNPILTRERKYTALRNEMNDFIDLVRELNKAALAPEQQGEMENVKARMREGIERMGAVAGKIDA